MQVFVVTDAPDERDFLSFVLQHAGLSVASSSDLQRIMAKWSRHPADLIVTAVDDRGALLNDIKIVRAATTIPLLIVMDPPSEEYLCALLDAGADLVLSRPVSPRVLSRYAFSLLRRSASEPAFVFPKLAIGDLKLDPATRTVAVAGGDPRHLTRLEFRLLYMLMTNHNQVLPTETIVERVWDFSGAGDRELVRGLVSRLRRKIEIDHDKPRFIHTIPGIGYRFSLDEV
jgi:DNA-binding response OmpR family regulator